MTHTNPEYIYHTYTPMAQQEGSSPFTVTCTNRRDLTLAFNSITHRQNDNQSDTLWLDTKGIHKGYTTWPLQHKKHNPWCMLGGRATVSRPRYTTQGQHLGELQRSRRLVTKSPARLDPLAAPGGPGLPLEPAPEPDILLLFIMSSSRPVLGNVSYMWWCPI